MQESANELNDSNLSELKANEPLGDLDEIELPSVPLFNPAKQLKEVK